MKKYLFFIVIVIISCQKSDESEPSIINPEDLPEKIFTGDLINPTKGELQNFYDQNYTKVIGEIQLINLDYLSDLSLLRKLRDVEGRLWIRDLEINNLEGLNNLERVDGYFILSRLNSADLSGLDKLVFVKELLLRDLEVLDLSDFNKLEEVGLLWLETLKIENLNGLDNLKAINSHFHIEVCNHLKNLEGATGLEVLNGDFSIFVAEELLDINLLPEIEVISGSLRISHCPKLVNLNGLGNLKLIKEDLMFLNVGVDDFEGFEKLEKIKGNFILLQNPIESFNGINKLKSINGDVFINECDNLINLEGLISIDSIGAELTIKLNENLLNLDGFNPNISYINSIVIVENFKLSDFCSLSDFIISAGPEYNFTTIPNAYNPVYEDFVNGDCSE